MSLYHVTTRKKLNRYLSIGRIKAPVRAWKKIESAERFSKQTGRLIILRLKDNKSFNQYEGHRGEAVISNIDYEINNI